MAIMHRFQTKLTRQHCILLGYIAVFVPSAVAFRSITYDSQNTVQQAFIDRVTLSLVLVTGPLMWVIFAMVLQAREVKSCIIALFT